VPAVSIILPVYNAASTILRAIQSIQEQNLNDWELIIVDDGSKDNTITLLENIISKDKRIVLLRQEHSGIVPALDAGLKIANAAIIARMDADDVMLPNRLEKQLQWLRDHPDTGLVSCLVEHVGNELQQGYAHYVDWINKIRSHKQISLNRFVDAPLAHPSVMFRKACVEQYGGYRQGDFPEDYELWLRWLEAGVRMEKVPEVLLQWYDEPKRLSRSNKNYREEAFDKIKVPYLLRWLEAHNPQHPAVYVWGAGKKSRKRLQFLLRQTQDQAALTVKAYFDVKYENRQLDYPVLNFQEIATMGDIFVLSAVNVRRVRKQIKDFLESLGKSEGTDFLFI
jgi:glycosyltransferase involved in cell wall biosynthesis